MSVGHNDVSARKLVMDVGNDVLSVRDVVTDVGDRYMRVDRKFGLETNGQQRQRTSDGTHVKDMNYPI